MSKYGQQAAYFLLSRCKELHWLAHLAVERLPNSIQVAGGIHINSKLQRFSLLLTDSCEALQLSK